jgi:high affinity Mn2+ porin
MGGFSKERHPVWWRSLACAILIVTLCNRLAIAQQIPAAGGASSTVPSLPEDPVPPAHPPLGTNGASENSKAPPQLRQTIEDQSDDQANPAFISKHLIADRFWLSGQSNFIFQAHTPFHAPYSGPNSFHSYGEDALSRTLTLYTD